MYILVKGHSRGGVAASIFANWLKDESSKEDSKVIRIELTLLDPVPGPLHFGKFNDITTSATQSTVIYSLTADRDLVHKIGFTPQIIRSADRIILTTEGHDCGTGIGSAWDHMGWAETIPVVIISGSEIHTFRYNPYSDYIGYLGDEMGEEGGYHATGSINCGEGGSVKSSTIYCYTGLDATTTDKVVTYDADGNPTEQTAE